MARQEGWSHLRKGWLTKPLVFLPVEVATRELDSRILLAAVLAIRGASVVLGPPGEVRRIAATLGHGSFIHNAHSHFDKEMFALLSSRNIAVTALYEEAVFIPQESNFYEKLRLDEIQPYVRKLFTWSTDQHERMLRTYPDLHSVLLFTGNPRFDLLGGVFSKFRSLSSFNEEIRRVRAPVVLFNSSAVLGNLAVEYGGFDALNERYAESDERTLAEGRALAEYHSKIQAESRRLLIQLAAQFHDVSFVIRPHPSENIESWQVQFDGVRNVLVTRVGTANDWIDESRIVVHTGCTTAVEASLLGKPVITYQPLEVPEREPQLPLAAGITCRSQESVAETIRRILRNEEVVVPLPEALIGAVSFSGDLNSAEKIANTLLVLSRESLMTTRLLESSPFFRRNSILLLAVRENLAFFAKRILKIFGRLRILGIRQPSLSSLKFSPLNHEELRAKLQEVLAVKTGSSISRTFEVFRLSDRAVVIELAGNNSELTPRTRRRWF